MRFRLALPLVLLVLSCPACGPKGGETSQTPAPPVADWPSAEERTLEEGFAPTPFTAAQIREGCPSGTRVLYHVEHPVKPPQRVLFSFDKADDKEVDLVITDLDLKNKVTSVPNSMRTTWEEIQARSSTPIENTVITQEQVTVPAGTFDCMLYTVTKPSEKGNVIDKFWFAYKLPGPFVKRSTQLVDEGTITLSLVSHEVVEDTEGK
jgi:hypothetical protein